MQTSIRGLRYALVGATWLVLMFSAVAVSPLSHAETATDIPALLKERRCYSCHDLTQSLIGPPYQAIAARHRARAEVMTEVLAQKIMRGGGGNWGVVPMVPNEHVSEEEARAMARWILQLNLSGN
jgi:cytochrome c